MYQEYYYRGPRSESDTTFFYLTTNRADFDSLFMYIYFPNETVDTIPSADIAAQKVVSIVKYGNDMCDLELKEVYLFGEMLVVDYTSTVTNQDMSSFAAISLIIMTDADFKRILFLENGRQIRELKL